MNRLTLLLTALVLPACASTPAPAAAQMTPGHHAEAQPRTIHVNAIGEVRRTPDRAVIALAVETTAATAGEASNRNAALMNTVLEAVRGLGIDRSDIQTRRLDLSPRYAVDRVVGDPRDPRPVEPQEPRITGYVAVNQVVVTVDDVGMVGRVVDAAIAAGANRVNGISFQLRDPEAAHHEAIRLAIQKARREAEVVAAALGEPLGPALNVVTSGYYAPPPPPMPMMDMRMERAAAAPAPVEPGELDVQASVSITFRIGT